MNDRIVLKHNNDIDISRWDACIISSSGTKVYAMSWYLNSISKDWYGFIMGDYEYVMPVFLGSKWGIKHILQPVFAQQHGVFPDADKEIVNSFLNSLLKQQAYINISLNSKNEIDTNIFDIRLKNNFILQLNKSYSELKNNYSKHAKRYSKKSRKDCNIKEVSISDFFAFVDKHCKLNFGSKNKSNLKNIIDNAKQQNSLKIYGAYHEDILCSCGAYIIFDKRITYLYGVSSDLGYKKRGMFAILDFIIEKHSESAYTLDFDGSEKDSIARFFKGFGSVNEAYPVIKKNNVPILKYFIK